MDLYPIKAILYGIKFFDEVYNMNNFDNQNGLKTRPQILELRKSLAQFIYMYIIYTHPSRHEHPTFVLVSTHR